MLVLCRRKSVPDYQIAMCADARRLLLYAVPGSGSLPATHKATDTNADIKVMKGVDAGYNILVRVYMEVVK